MVHIRSEETFFAKRENTTLNKNNDHDGDRH